MLSLNFSERLFCWQSWSVRALWVRKFRAETQQLRYWQTQLQKLETHIPTQTLLTWIEKTMSKKKKILILCTGNSARSQMAEGLLKHITQSKYEVFSAGTKPSIVRPEAIKVLAEIGIDIEHNRSKSADEFANEEIDCVLTLCDNAKETCPFFPAKTKVIHHSFEDPPAIGEADEETTLKIFRRVRDKIEKYLRQAISQNIFD